MLPPFLMQLFITDQLNAPQGEQLQKASPPPLFPFITHSVSYKKHDRKQNRAQVIQKPEHTRLNGRRRACACHKHSMKNKHRTFLTCIICHTKQKTKHIKCLRNKTHLYSTCNIFLLVWMVVEKCVCFSIRLPLQSTSPVQRPLIKAPQLLCNLCIYIQYNLYPRQFCELINEWCYV